MSNAAVKSKIIDVQLSPVQNRRKRNFAPRPAFIGASTLLLTALSCELFHTNAKTALPFPQAGLWLAILAIFAMLVLLRSGWQSLGEKRAATGALSVVILGSVEAASGLWDSLSNDPDDVNEACDQVRISGVFADGITEQRETAGHDVVMNEAQWAKSFVECCGIRHAIVAVPLECDEKTNELVNNSSRIIEELYIAPQIRCNEVTARVAVTEQSGLQVWVGGNSHEANTFQRAPSETHVAKRVLDIAGALVLCLLALPFLLFVAIAIPLTSRGPLLYKQLRVGKGNRMFFAFKFRTMFTNASDRLTHYLDQDPALRLEWERVHKLRDDPRVTSVGRFLRRFSLDELPQVWNVLMGEMSLIGPRPIVVSEVARYGLDYAAYEAVRPGLTGLWQVSGRNDTTYQERVDFDSYYVRNWSLGLDARIVVRTFRAVISGQGAY